MAERTSKKKQADAGQAEAQKLADQAEEKGYLGNKVDPLPNSAHSLESGPDSPPVQEAELRTHIADVNEED